MQAKKLILGAVAVAFASTLYTAAPPAIAAEMTLPALVYRTGAYAPNGVPFANGLSDYIALVNSRGGVNGIKVNLIECETGYKTDVGVECYERLKGEGESGAAVFNPRSTGFT